jgi:hypothetical protein
VPHRFFCVAVVGKELQPRRRRRVVFLRLGATIVDRELLEVCQDFCAESRVSLRLLWPACRGRRRRSKIAPWIRALHR